MSSNDDNNPKDSAAGGGAGGDNPGDVKPGDGTPTPQPEGSK